MSLSLEKRTQRTATKLLKLFGPTGQKWTYGSYAKDKNGEDVDLRSRKAVSWCFAGAMTKLKVPGDVQQVIGDLIPKSKEVETFNDTKPHKYDRVKTFLQKVEAGKLFKKVE